MVKILAQKKVKCGSEKITCPLKMFVFISTKMAIDAPRFGLKRPVDWHTHSLWSWCLAWRDFWLHLQEGRRYRERLSLSLSPSAEQMWLTVDETGRVRADCPKLSDRYNKKTYTSINVHCQHFILATGFVSCNYNWRRYRGWRRHSFKTFIPLSFLTVCSCVKLYSGFSNCTHFLLV